MHTSPHLVVDNSRKFPPPKRSRSPDYFSTLPLEILELMRQIAELSRRTPENIPVVAVLVSSLLCDAPARIGINT